MGGEYTVSLSDCPGVIQAVTDWQKYSQPTHTWSLVQLLYGHFHLSVLVSNTVTFPHYSHSGSFLPVVPISISMIQDASLPACIFFDVRHLFWYNLSNGFSVACLIIRRSPFRKYLVYEHQQWSQCNIRGLLLVLKMMPALLSIDNRPAHQFLFHIFLSVYSRDSDFTLLILSCSSGF